MRHINLPVFIPHRGCPNDCVFCNQRTISGHSDYSPEAVRHEIETALSTLPENAEVQIAFFGGSFTGIDRSEMVYLLSVAKEFIDSGKVDSVRLSTRPDYIDEERLEILRSYGVRTVELGIQSTSDKVLAAANRGHTAEDSERAMRLIKKYGFELVGQMMVGLPEATPEDEQKTAEDICSWGADAARIYPTVVFHKTELCEMARKGEYTPLTLEDAVERSKKVKKIFIKHGVECIRLGLQSGENLTEPDGVYAGDYHSAIGELVESRIYRDLIVSEIKKLGIGEKLAGRELVIQVPHGEVSKVVGQKGENKTFLKNEYCVKNVKVIEKDSVLRYNIILSV